MADECVVNNWSVDTILQQPLEPYKCIAVNYLGIHIALLPAIVTDGCGIYIQHTRNDSTHTGQTDERHVCTQVVDGGRYSVRV